MGRLSGRGLGNRLDAAPKQMRRAAPMLGAAKARPFKKWYSTARWQKLRLEVFARDGYVCQATGVACVGGKGDPSAPTCDHIIPHRGNPLLFWDKDNLQTVTAEYHSGEKQRLEATGDLDV
jgi:5-methylcytosine-specific restriction enzyme A